MNVSVNGHIPQLCNELVTYPGCTLLLPNVSWDWLQPPVTLKRIHII